MVRGKSELIDHCEADLKKYFKGKTKKFSVPLDLKGTKFQREVWSQLVKIPHGKTKTYGHIAKLVKKPNASRAVGKANGDNYLAIIIPCHRVIQSDGHLRGYGGGL